MAQLFSRFRNGFRGQLNPGGGGGGGGGGGDVPSSRTITAGAGMTGGGDLSTNRTLDVVANADGSIVVNANDIQVGVLATDAQHGDLGNGTLHTAATSSANGFMPSTDKAKLDLYASTSATVSVSTTAQATATQLTAQINTVTGGSQFDACKLPASWTIGIPVYVINRLGTRTAGVLNFIRVFTPSGESANFTNQAANAAHFLPCETVGIYIKISSTVWHVATFPMPVGQSGFSITDDFYCYRAAQFLGGITMSSNVAIGNGSSFRLADNSSEASYFGESTNRYLSFVTTDNAEAILFYKRISGYLASVNNQTTDYTLVVTAGTGDQGKIVEIDSGTAKNVTLPPTAVVGTSATIVQKGDGQITFITTGTGSIVNVDGHTKSKGKYAMCTVYVSTNSDNSSAVWVLGGATGA